MQSITNLIFDWSGTLVDDLPPVIHATNAVLRHCGRPPLTRAQFLHEFELPFQRFYDRMIPGVALSALEPVFHDAFVRSESRATPLPHAQEFLLWCRRRKHRCFVLSAAHPAHLEDQARSFGFHPFFEAVHAGVRDKTERIHLLLKQHRLHPQHTTFIGDMTHDIEAARHGGIHSVAVLTGYQDQNRLASASPDLVVQNLAELQSLMDPTPSTALSLK